MALNCGLIFRYFSTVRHAGIILPGWCYQGQLFDKLTMVKFKFGPYCQNANDLTSWPSEHTCIYVQVHISWLVYKVRLKLLKKRSLFMTYTHIFWLNSIKISIHKYACTDIVLMPISCIGSTVLIFYFK